MDERNSVGEARGRKRGGEEEEAGHVTVRRARRPEANAEPWVQDACREVQARRGSDEAESPQATPLSPEVTNGYTLG